MTYDQVAGTLGIIYHTIYRLMSHDKFGKSVENRTCLKQNISIGRIAKIVITKSAGNNRKPALKTIKMFTACGHRAFQATIQWLFKKISVHKIYQTTSPDKGCQCHRNARCWRRPWWGTTGGFWTEDRKFWWKSLLLHSFTRPYREMIIFGCPARVKRFLRGQSSRRWRFNQGQWLAKACSKSGMSSSDAGYLGLKACIRSS